MEQLIKIFKCKKYANDFLNGNLYCNTLDYFRKLESNEKERGDKREGQLPLPIESIQFESKELGKHTYKVVNTPEKLPTFSYQGIEYINIFSMSFIPAKIRNKTLDLKISSRHFECFGNYLVVVLHFPEFMSRIKKTLNNSNYIYGCQKVNYYNPDQVVAPEHQFEELIFMKDHKFKWQNEYRIAFETNIQNNQPVTLKIGDINDIAMLADNEKKEVYFNKIQFDK